jgi:hypothetical protein
MEPKGGCNMKKFLAGTLFGCILVFGITGYADSLVGKQVDTVFPLIINGDQSSKNVISIEGTSYLPVRSAGEMFGYDVNFTNETVYLDKKEVGVLQGEEDIIYEDTSNINQNASKNVKSIVQQAVENSTTMAYDSETLNLYWVGKKETRTIKLGGEIFISPEVFYYYVKYNEPIMTFTFPELDPIDITIPNTESEIDYQEGMNAVTWGASTYIKLSALGLDITEKNGTLWIEAP